MINFIKKILFIKKNKLHHVFRYVNKGDIVFDIGAHHGEKSIKLVQYCSKLVLVEPQPDCLKVLKKKFLNFKNVEIIPYGVSSKKEILNLKINSQNPLVSTFSDHWDKGRFSNKYWDKSIKIQTTTIDQLIKDYGKPKFIKIDVEGFELNVLKGLKEKTGIISFEFTSEFFEEAIKCLDHLNQLGYESFNFSEGERKKFYTNWSTKKNTLNLLNKLILSNRDFWGDIYAK